MRQLVALALFLAFHLPSYAVEQQRLPADLGNPLDVPTDAFLLSEEITALEGTLAAGETYSLAPLVDDSSSSYYLSTAAAPTSHTFDEVNETGGGNYFGTAGSFVRISENVVSLGGGIDRYIVEVSAVNSSGFLEPWVDASWTGNGLIRWRLDVGSTYGGIDPIQFASPIDVVNSGYIAYNSSGAALGSFAMYSDTSTSTSLSGVALLNNGGSDIAGINVAALQMYWDVTPAPADLALQFVDVSPGTYSPGDTVDVHNVTENIGGMTSTAYTITFYASTDNIISESDIPLGFIDRLALDAGELHNVNSSRVLPLDLPAGDYYVGAILTVSDTTAANNSNYDPVPISVLAETADLSLQIVDAEDGTYTPGSALNVFVLWENVGGSASVSSSLSVYASTDTTITPGDRLIGSFDVSPLEPGALGGGNAGTTLPVDLVSGNYYIGGILNISDADSTNNIYYDYNPITVTTDPEIRISPLVLDFTEQAQPLVAISKVLDNDIAPYEMTQTVLPNLMAKAEKAGEVRVIVGFEVPFRPEGFLNAAEKQSQRQQIQDRGRQLTDILRGFNFQEKRRFRFTPYVALTVDANALEHLSRSPMVTSISEDSLSLPTLASSNYVIGSPLVWAEGYEGTGQTVAILDTGVDKAHPWFTTGGSTVVSEACYSTTGGVATSVCPGGVPSSTAPGSGISCDVSIAGCDHGTHVAGIAAGNDTTGPNFGVARGADIIAIQVFTRIDDQGICGSPSPCIRTLTSDQISALERVYELRETFDIAAVNMSLGGGQFFNQATCDAANPSQKAVIDLLRSVDIATVIASGNDGWKDSISAPGCISSAISVGNSTDSDAVAGSSNVYPQIHLLAPGTSITSSVPGGGTAVKNGTSMAAPHVAGAWSVLKQVNPGATVDDIFNALQNTGTLVDDLRPAGIKTNIPRINVDLAIGEPRTTFGIFNDGLVLTVSSITTETAAPWISWSPEAPFDIQPGELKVVSVNIDFAKAPGGVSQTRLLINSNDPDESPYPGGVFVNVTASAKPAPEFDSTPLAGATIAFGDQIENMESGALNVQVDNLGDADLTLECSLSGTNPASFDLKACPTPIAGAASGNILVSCQPVSVGSKTATLDVLTNDTDEPTVSYNLTCTGVETPTPEYDSTPAAGATLAFGDQVEQTESTDLTVQIDNLGDVDLTLGCSITGLDSSSFNLKACPTPIIGEGSGNIAISCQPQSLGAKSAVLEVNTNDADEASVTYSLTCAGITVPVPEFDSTPAPSATLAFGEQVKQTESTDLTVQVSNLGGADLTLGCSITGSDIGSFVLKACPTTIAGAGSGNISVSCQPESIGAKAATLEVVTNDADEPNVSYNLTCIGIENPPTEIVFSDGFEG